MKLTEDQKAYLRAAAGGDLDQLQKLLSSGVPVDLSDAELFILGPAWDTTALMYAAAKGRLEVVRLLLKSGADVSVQSKNHKVDGGGGSQAIHFAAAGPIPAVIEELLNAGADPNAQGNWGRTPLTFAARAGKLDNVRLLLKRGADVKFKSKKKADMGPLYAVVSADDIAPPLKRALVELLLKNGADPNVTGELNLSALMRITGVRDIPDEIRFQMTEMMLDAGAKIDHADKFGQTAFESALSRNCPKTARLLIDRGADVNRDGGRGTPLKLAERNAKEIRTRLAANSLPESERQSLNQQLLESEELVKVLLDKGAKQSNQ